MWTWNGKRERAALLCAEDQLTDQQIADQSGITLRGYAIWKTHPEFQQRVRELLDETRAAVRAEGIANRQNRVDAANDRWRRLQQVIEARAADESMAAVPGGSTGLLVRTYKLAGGRAPIVREEYAVDTPTLTEMRGLEKQTAQDLGQWVEKQEQHGDLIVREYQGVDPAEV